jgi:hypothetical protein
MSDVLMRAGAGNYYEREELQEQLEAAEEQNEKLMEELKQMLEQEKRTATASNPRISEQVLHTLKSREESVRVKLQQ